MLTELHHLARAAFQVASQPTLLAAELRRTRPARLRRSRERRLTERHAHDTLPGLGRQQLHIDHAGYGLVPGEISQRRLLLVHVPKTGGTSLRLMLADHVPPERTFLSTGAYQWADSSIRALAGAELFVGHNFLEPLYLLPDQEWVTMLMVREPIAWWRSWYTYRRTQAIMGGDRASRLRRQNLGEWIDGCSDTMLSNGQASWLLARVRLMFDNPMLPLDAISRSGAHLGRDPEVALDILDRLLDRISVLGVTEELLETYEAGCRAMGWSPSHQVSLRDNVSAYKSGLTDLTDLQVLRLRNLNVLDQHMYERALAATAERRVVDIRSRTQLAVTAR